MTLNIRSAERADVGLITDLVNMAYRPTDTSHGWTHESDIISGARATSQDVQQLLSENSLVFVAEQQGEIVACVHLKANNASAYIGMLATSPKLQAKGYGKIMLAYAEDYARKHWQVDHFEMVVVAERAELVAFYLRRGYRKTEQTYDYPITAGLGTPRVSGLSIMVLQKSLTPASLTSSFDPSNNPTAGNL